MHFYILIGIFLTTSANAAENTGPSVLEKLKSSLKLAGKFFSTDHANDVTYLVSEAFKKSHTNNANNEKQNIFSGFLRVLGFDSRKIGAITVNAIIFMAQLISSFVSLKPPLQLTENKSAKDDSLFDWMLNSVALSELILRAKDKNLTEHVIEYVKERSMDEETGCIQLLLCKSTPFVKKMQQSIGETKNYTVTGYAALMTYVPTLEEVSDFGDDCDKKHPYCSIPLY